MKIVVFDLDETMGYFTQYGIFWDCLVNYLHLKNQRQLTEDDFNHILDLFPEFVRPNIINILTYLKSKKLTNCCSKMMIYTNNTGPREWANHIIEYFESKIEDARQRILEEIDEDLDMISRTSNIRKLFEALPRNHKRRDVYTKILEKILHLSGSKPDDFIKYDGLFPSLLFILTNRYGYFIGEFETLLGNIASTEERKAALKAKFSEYRISTDKDTSRLQRVLIDVGVLDIYEGGRHTRIRKHRKQSRRKTLKSRPVVTV